MISKRLLKILIIIGILGIVLGNVGIVAISNEILRRIMPIIEGLGWGCLIGGIGTLYKQKNAYK